jgi:hypothetical protein
MQFSRNDLLDLDPLFSAYIVGVSLSVALPFRLEFDANETPSSPNSFSSSSPNFSPKS